MANTNTVKKNWWDEVFSQEEEKPDLASIIGVKAPLLAGEEQTKVTEKAASEEVVALTPDEEAASEEIVALTPTEEAASEEVVALTPDEEAASEEIVALTPAEEAVPEEIVALTPTEEAASEEVVALTPAEEAAPDPGKEQKTSTSEDPEKFQAKAEAFFTKFVELNLDINPAKKDK